MGNDDSQKYTTLVGAVLGAEDRIKTHRFIPSGSVVSVPFVEYQNGMLYVPATGELKNCNLRHPRTGLVLESGYTPLRQRFSRHIEKPTLGNGVTLDHRVTTLKYSIDASGDESAGTFDISASDMWLDGSGEDTHGFRVMYTWEGSYDVNHSPVATPVCRKEVRIYDEAKTWTCPFANDGKLYQALLQNDSRREDATPAVISLDPKYQSEHKTRLETLFEKYHLHIINHNMDWDVTLRNIVAGNTAVPAYVGE